MIACVSANNYSAHKMCLCVTVHNAYVIRTCVCVRDTSVASNWRPIAILKVTYKIFSKMLCSRLQPLHESYQSPDQVGVRPHRGTDHAFAVFDTICGKSVEWKCNLWFASLDVKKAFDRMEHNALFAALAKQGVESSYIQLLKALYLGQTGSVHGSRRFRITRGVKQGDVLSPLLFNAGLEAAIQSWKSRIADCGIHVGHTERLTNIRFADDLMVYSKSSSELAYMLEVLSEELLKVGLQPNPQKNQNFDDNRAGIANVFGCAWRYDFGFARERPTSVPWTFIVRQSP